jgi:hypothetical protein
MKLRVTKSRVAFCLLAALGLLLGSCFQPVDIGETFIEEGTAHLKLSNDSEDDSYILEGFELWNAEGETVQSWEGLDLAAGKSRDLHTETEGSYTLWYRVKDTWISETAVDRWEAGPVDIALNKSHEFSFKRENFKVTSQDGDRDGLPDIWETENGFDPEYPADGGPVYVSADGQDEIDEIDELDEIDSQDETGGPNRVLLGTREHPYKTLAKAVDKARRGLNDAACTVVVLGELNWLNGNSPDPENQEESKSLFSLGKTRHPLTIRPENPENLDNPGVLRGYLTALKRVLYIGPGADITLLNMTITGGKQKGGGIYASGATLTLGPGTTVTGNESYDLTAGEAGGIYMERGTLVMEPGSLVTENTAYVAGGVVLHASQFTMNGGKILKNYGKGSVGGLNADGCTIEMFDGAEISENEGGTDKNTTATGRHTGGAAIMFSTLTMHQGSKISGNKIYNGFAGGIYVTGESNLIMKAGSKISGNTCTRGENSGTGMGGGVELAYRSSLTMKDGSTISGNTAERIGGGVYLLADSSLTMEGGSISDNTAEKEGRGDGGGVFLDGGNSFTMTGGSVKNNTAAGNGGGIYVFTTTFTMTGGDITGNKAGGAGGGVFLEYGASFNMTNGAIAKNTAKTLGGGIYVRGYARDAVPDKNISFIPAAVFTMSGGHVYGTGGGDNANTAEKNNGTNAGQAVYVGKNPDNSSVPHDNTIGSFPVPAPPAP